MPAKKATEPVAEDTPDEAAAAVEPEPVEIDETRVHLVQTHAVHAGADDEGNALDHIGTPYDHVIEVSN